MRPVDKGSAPHPYSNYQEAGPDLQARLGDYCSYCERQIATHLAVEHIRPKSLEPSLATDWSNFLLACTNCNSCKGDTPINLLDHFWPDMDNTLRALRYSRGGVITPASDLPSALQSKAASMIRLLGLDKDPGNPDPNRHPTRDDKRCQTRQKVWQVAQKSLSRLQKDPSNTYMREQIVETAIPRGHFSIWWTVFAGDVDMRKRFREAFPGTDPGSFDPQEHLRHRPGGQI
ncbi:MAG: HNH endonuclease [Magnetococcus sp. YQC-9]